MSPSQPHLRCLLIILLVAAGCATGSPAAADAPNRPDVSETASAPLSAPSAATTTHAHRHHAAHHRFEDAQTWAKMFDDPARDQWQKPEAVLDKLGLGPDTRIADIGAGTGYFAVHLARAVPQGFVLAADIEPDMVRYTRERAQKAALTNLFAVQSQPEDPRLGHTVDVAFFCDTYHHLEQRSLYFRRLAEHLAPKGRVVIVDFKPDAPAGTPGPPPQHRIAPEIVAEELAEAGYRHVETDTSLLPYQYIAIFERP